MAVSLGEQQTHRHLGFIAFHLGPNSHVFYFYRYQQNVCLGWSKAHLWLFIRGTEALPMCPDMTRWPCLAVGYSDHTRIRLPKYTWPHENDNVYGLCYLSKRIRKEISRFCDHATCTRGGESGGKVVLFMFVSVLGCTAS